MAKHSRVARLLIVMLLVGSTAVPGSFVCEHCACYRDRPSVRRPVRCDTIGKEAECCVLPSS